MKRDNWSSPDLLPKQIVLVDGVTRSGKSMIGPVIGSLNKTYPMQHQDLLNNLMPILHKKKISIEAARSLLIFYFSLDWPRPEWFYPHYYKRHLRSGDGR